MVSIDADTLRAGQPARADALAHERLRLVVQEPREGLVGEDEAARGVQGVEQGQGVGRLLHQVVEHLRGRVEGKNQSRIQDKT